MSPYFVRMAALETVPGLEPMTLQSRTSNTTPASFTSYAVPRAKRRPLASSAGAGNPGLAQATMVIEVWAEALASVGAPNPKPGDLWVDAAGRSWLVVPEGVETALMDQRFNCHVQQQTA